MEQKISKKPQSAEQKPMHRHSYWKICFVDDRDDYDLYQSVGYKAIGKAIAYAIMNKPMQEVEMNKVTGRVADQAAADGNWYYYENGQIVNKTTVAPNENGWWFVRDVKWTLPTPESPRTKTAGGAS